MIGNVSGFFDAALGLSGETITTWQMALRAALVYVAALALVRVGDKRFLGKSTAFDVILAIILGSVVSRAINSTDAFFQTLVAGLVLVGLHWAMAAIAFHSDSFGTVFKGSERTLVRDGEVLRDALARSHLSERDLAGALRRNASVRDVTEVELACLERSGEISVIKRGSGPRVLEVRIEPGVQTVRIQLE